MGAEEGSMAKRPHCAKASQPNSGHTSPAGYGKPPVHAQFKPGRSGNPKGRPKGLRNIRSVIEEALNQRITIREGDRTRSLTKLDGVILTMITGALKGNPNCRIYEKDGVRIFIGDQADRSFWREFRQKVPILDIVID